MDIVQVIAIYANISDPCIMDAKTVWNSIYSCFIDLFSSDHYSRNVKI